MLRSAFVLKKASSVTVLPPSQSNHKRVQDVIDKISHRGNHPKISDFLKALQDFVNGAPSPFLALAYDGSHKMIGALTFLDSKDEQEIKAIGVVDGEETARALIRALNHGKTLTVSASPSNHSLFKSLGFIHSEELDDEGGPSEMVKLPPGKQASMRHWAAFHNRGWIDPDGTFHAVDGSFSGKTWGPTYDPKKYQHHDDVADEIYGEGGFEKALAHGWIRCGIYDGWGYAQMEKPCNDTQFNAFVDFIGRIEPKMVRFSGAVEGDLSLNEFLCCRNFSALRKELRGTSNTVPTRMQTKVRDNPRVASADVVQRAYEFAKRAHESIDQRRKYTGDPYIVHPEGVVAILKQWGILSPNILAAAYLHDTVEDTPVTLEEVEQEFGPEIGTLVEMLTDTAKPEDGNRATRMGINLKHSAAGSADAQNIKLADVDYNIHDIFKNDPGGFAHLFLKEKEELVRALNNADPKFRDHVLNEIIELRKQLPPRKKKSAVDYDLEDEEGFREVRVIVKHEDQLTDRWEILATPSESGISANIRIIKPDHSVMGTVVHGEDSQAIEQAILSVVDEWYGTRYEKDASAVKSQILADMAKSFRTEPNPKPLMRFASVAQEFTVNYYGLHNAGTGTNEIQAEVHEDGNNEITVEAGFCSITGRILADMETFKLFEIWVPPTERNQGYGQALMMKLAEYLKANGIKYILGQDTNADHIPEKLRNKIPGAKTVRLDLREESEPSAASILGETTQALSEFLDDYTPDPSGVTMLTKIAKVISTMEWGKPKKGASMRYVMASSILAKGPVEAKDAEVPSSRIGETLWRALAFMEASRRLSSIESGSKLRSMNEVANLTAKVAELSRHPINKPDMDALRNELVATAKSCLTEGQLKRVRLGRWAEWSRAGRKLLPLLPENLTKALLSWGSTHSAKTAANLSDLFCTNSDCKDFEKRGHGNLTQEFAYGVDGDRHMLYCTTCKKRFSETKCTEFFGAKLNGEDISKILKKTVEGKSIRDIADELDLNKDSVNNVILKAKEICEEYVSGGKADVGRDALGDMNLEKGNKGDLSSFINEIVIPGINGSDDKDEKKDTKDDEE